MPKDGQNNTNQEVEKALDYEQVVKSSIMFDASAGEDLLSGVANDKELKQIVNSELFDEIHTYQNNNEDGTSIFEQAFIEKPQGYDRLLDQAGNQVNLLKIKDKEAYDKYRSIIAQGADKLDEFIDKSVVVNDEYGEKAKEFIVTCSTGRIRRSVNGGADRYLQFKHLLGGGNASMYAALNASVVDYRLQINIEKWQHKMPIHQLVIDGGKQLQTMTDYWAEKEENKGVLPPDREQEYRQKLYDQTVSMSALYDKVVDTLEDRQANAEMDADKLFGNQSFHIHPRSIRGSASFKCGLHAMKVGLENGWAIEDTARLAAFYQVVYKTESQLICNGGMEYDNFKMYDKPKYQSPEHERYMDRLKSAWEIVEETKLEAPGERKAILSNLDKLVEEGLEKGYLDKSGPVHYYQQTIKQAVVRDSLVASGAAPAFYDQKSNIKTGEGRRIDIIFPNMNAARNRSGSESLEHKNMRVALEELQTFLKENPKKNPAAVSKEELLDYNTKYMEKLVAVKKTSEKYKATHPHPKTSAGKTRLQGADEAFRLAGVEIESTMSQLKKEGLCAAEDTMESFRIKNTVRQNGYNETLRGYKEAIKVQTNTINELIGNLKAVDGWTSSPNFKNLKNGLNELKAFSEKINKSSKDINPTDLEKYQKLVDKAGELADTYLKNKKDIKSEYARSRVRAVNRVKTGLANISVGFSEAYKDLEKKKKKELFGEKYKMYDQLSYGEHEHADTFWGEKYRSKESRTKGKGEYTVNRTAGISVSIFALANTGKYTFEDIMDPSKLQAEKQEMFDKVVTAMQNPTPESQKWIAETIYNGQKTTENMMNEAAKKVDFAKADTSNDKTYCQMLHMSHYQFDSWQEMAHCKKEIMELVKKDHPEMTKWEEYKDWWTNRQGVMGSLNTAINNKRDNIISVAMADEANLITKVTQYSISEKMIKADLAKAQTEKKDIPFVDWMPPEKDMEYGLVDMVGYKSILAQQELLKKNPEVTKALMPKFADGSILKDVSIENISIEKGTADIKGFPGVDDLKKIAETEQFLQKTDAALGRLENGKYTNKKSFIEDSAYAMIGQMYRANGDKLPEKDGKVMSLEDYKDMQIASKAFVDSLMVPGSPNKFISPKKIAAMANNSQKIHNMAKDRAAEMNNNKTVQQNVQRRTVQNVKKVEAGGKAMRRP